MDRSVFTIEDMRRNRSGQVHSVFADLMCPCTARALSTQKYLFVVWPPYGAHTTHVSSLPVVDGRHTRNGCGRGHKVGKEGQGREYTCPWKSVR